MSIRYADIEKMVHDGRLRSGKTRISFVLSSLTSGGAERVLITLMNSLDQRLYEPELIVFDEKGELSSWINVNIPVHSFGHTKVKYALPKLVKRLNISAPDIIVSTMAATNFTVLMAKPFLKKPAKIIVREAVTPSSIIEGRATGALVRMAYRALYPRADMVVSPAQCIIDEFRSYLGMDVQNHELLHNPVITSRIRGHERCAALPATKTSRSETVHFVCAGRLHHQKGFDRLLNALPNMIMPYNWHLTIMGTGPEEETLKALIEKNGLQDKVTMRGLVKKPWPVMAAADMFLLPSRWEGLPNVVLESLSAGTPVISMDEAGGIAEIADLAGAHIVQVKSTMRDFVKAMEKTRPHPSETFRPSLLPSHFEQHAVTQRFATLLRDDRYQDGSVFPQFHAHKTKMLDKKAHTTKAA